MKKSKKNKFLYPAAGFGFLFLLVLSYRLGAASNPNPAPAPPVRPSAPAITRPAPTPVPKPPPPPTAAAPLFPKGKGKIAIVLDDWGYTMKQVPALKGIRRPVTVAVLPGLAHSTDVDRAASAGGHEVILHMPMEPMDPNAPREGSMLRSGMPKKEVLILLGRSLGTVPSARGINNHQGSKATSDPALMEIVLQETKRRGLYFLDSYVSKQSVCAEVAQRVKLPFARRTVFLDNEASDAAIQKQLVELARLASQRGEAIGIGHDRPATIRVLQKALPELEKAGYTLVPASELTEVPDAGSGY